MAKNGIYDLEFFDELDKQVSPVLANSSILQPRHFYGALYAYYKFERGRPENILFYETCLEEEPSVLHSEMTSEIFELANTCKNVDKDRLDLFITNFFKPNFLSNMDQEVRFKQRLIAEYHRIFSKVNYLDEEVWDKLIDITIKAPRISNIDKYETMLKGLIWYNDNPKSPKFKKLGKQIQGFKDRIRNNPNRLWKYDPERVRWRTYDELLLTREDIDENYLHAFELAEMVKQDIEEVEEQKEYTIDEVKNMVKEKIKEKMPLIKIKQELLDALVPSELVEKSILDITKENQDRMVESLRRKGVFIPDVNEIEKIEGRKNMMKTVLPTKGAPGKKDDKKKK